MAVPKYSFVACDILTGRMIARLQPQSFDVSATFSHVGVGSGDFILPVDSQELSIIDVNDPGRMAVYGYHDGQLFWGGPVWDTEYSYDVNGAETMTLKCLDWWSWFQKQYFRTDALWTNVDQMNIFGDMLRVATGHTATYGIDRNGAATGSAVPFPNNTNVRLIQPADVPSGVLRTISYYSYDVKNIGQACEELARSFNGFEFYVGVQIHPTDGLPAPVVRVGFPRLGLSKAATTYRWKIGLNASRLSMYKYGSQIANVISGIGAGSGDAMALANVDATSASSSIPALGATLTDKNAAAASILTESQGAVQTVAPEVPDMDVLADHEPQLGVWSLGDHARVLCESGMYPRKDLAGRDRRLNAVYRVIGYALKVDDYGAERLTPTFNKAMF